MPMMLTSLSASPEGQTLGRQTYYGHQKRSATKCGHEIHPASSRYTPWCPICTSSLAKARLDAAQKRLVAEGGLVPAGYMRDRQWNLARLRHDIARRRLEKSRKEDQLRWEREAAWDEAHKRYDSHCFQAAAECPSCRSMLAAHSIKVPQIQFARNVAWWEVSGALSVQHSTVPRARLPLCNQQRKFTLRPEKSQALRKIIQILQASESAASLQRQVWEARYRTESAVRRKHSLGENFPIDAQFWESPISLLATRRYYQQVQEDQRMAARRARGNTTRPRPPRSSLSYTRVSEEVLVDQAWVETLIQNEGREELERETRKVAEEVGYLYFVGLVQGMDDWREDYLRSNRQLVARNQAPGSMTSEIDSDDDGSSDEHGDKENLEAMDIDEL